ncbi:MAG TPA: hypothetical protein VE527_16850, partial [Reyranella sp.]|nr:hypothetical protein [Reyranella sp.]
ADQPHLRLLYQCSPRHSSSPLHPIVEQLRRAAGFERDETDEAKLGKLEALLGACPCKAVLLSTAGVGGDPLVR